MVVTGWEEVDATKHSEEFVPTQLVLLVLLLRLEGPEVDRRERALVVREERLREEFEGFQAEERRRSCL